MSERDGGMDGGWAPPSSEAPIYASRTWRPDPASWGSRVGASLLDGLLIFGIALVAGLVIGATISDNDGAPADSGLLWILAGALYSPLMLAFNHGQTLGKKALGIRVLNADHAPIGLGRALLRELPVKYICGIIPLIDVLWPLWQSENKALHDLMARTWVVEANS
jgi:uncharacterized RDD family membrane protein YckC